MKHDLAVNLYFTAHRMGSGSSKRLVIQPHTANDALKNSSNLTEIVKPDLIDAQQIEDLGMKNTEKKPDLLSEGQRNEGNPSQPNSVTPNGNELSKEDKVEDQASKQESAKQKEVKEEGGKHEEKPVPQENKLTDEETTKKEKTNSDDHSALCDSFFKKYPSVKGVFQSLFNCYQELKEALNSENLVSSSSTVTLAERVFASYPNCKVRPNKAGLTDFALELGFPKLIHDIITTLISEYPEITSWDRAKDLESQQESTSASQGDTDEEKEAKLKTAQDLINNLIGAVLNFSDLHDPFCLAYSEAGMVPVYVRLITELKDSVAHNARFVDPKTQSPSKYTVRGKILSRSLGTLHNLSKRVPVRHTFAACDAVGVLIPFLKAEVTMYATKALLVLAYLIDEENNHLIMADEGPIKFLTNTLKTAVTMKSHRFLGFSAAELAEGLTQIAVNDKNKRTIAQCGAIPVLTDMLINARDDLEKVNACSTLWTLAFDAENRKEIKANEKAVKKLRDLTSSKNDGIRQAAAGALWEVEVKEKHAETRSMAGNEDNAVSKHIMISYQWDVQSSMIQLKNRLQADGYKVWMDVDQMGGSTLESMAKAVEDACVVLIGVSQKYKESPNCRSEAEYTFQLHRDIIPLMVEKRYKPDGWLGMVMGSKFWIDFTDRHKLDSGIEKLKKELGNRGTSKGQDTVTVVNADTLDAIPVPSIKSWTHDDVKQWLVDLDLHGRMSPTAVKRLNGALLMRLQDLRRESPEFFYSSIRKDFGLANVFDVLEFTDELDKLVG